MAIEDEREVSPTLDGIRRDHRERYRLAASFISEGAWVLDAACGIGYGSWMMAEMAQPTHVVGVDISLDAVAYGLRHYPHPGVTLMCADLLKLDLGGQRFDVIVSFEALEHVAEDRAFLAKLGQLLVPGGTLMVSTPNEDVLPFDPSNHAHHVRHYKSAEFTGLLAESGFGLIAAYAQDDREAGDIRLGLGGAFDIAVCANIGLADAAEIARLCPVALGQG
ncbi:MAG: methyltransferase domain-containing protein [Armatimonadota bacterium]|nr:MAG: methyltransferase domain-containing protein [Armatimonadota bacterium]